MLRTAAFYAKREFTMFVAPLRRLGSGAPVGSSAGASPVVNIGRSPGEVPGTRSAGSPVLLPKLQELQTPRAQAPAMIAARDVFQDASSTTPKEKLQAYAGRAGIQKERTMENAFIAPEADQPCNKTF